MIDIVYDKKFLKEFKKLPQFVQENLAERGDIFQEDAFHPSLFTKKLHGKLKDFYSFRVVSKYRVVFEFLDSGTAYFLSVRHCKDVYRLFQ